MKSNIKYYFLVSVIGFFSILSQTILFRNFLTAFDGNELSIGLFFFSWLLWICVGAYIAKIVFINKASDFFPQLVLLYIPFFVIQFLIFQFSGGLTGVDFYESASLSKIALFVFVYNAPLSFLTGFLFVSATGWLNKKVSVFIPVIQVYFCEVAGSFAGALGVTVLLYFSFSEGTIFLTASLIVLILSLPLIFESESLLQKVFYSVVTVLFITVLFSPLPAKMEKTNFLQLWNNLIKGGKFEGGFSTPQAKYVYGKYRNEFIVVSSNSVYETIPNLDAASNLAAEYLAQKPEAKNILVIGPGIYSLCSALNKIPAINKIYCLDSDPQYSLRLEKILPESGKDNSQKLKIISSDVRDFLQKTDIKYDLVVLNFPAPANLFLNRYFTKEFFYEVKDVLNSGGVVGVRFPGGDNYLGPELSYLGSSIYFTLSSVFRYIVLKPGSESILFAAENQSIITDSCLKLAQRLKSIKGLEKIYSADQIRSSYEKSRIDFQNSIYFNLNKTIPEKFLINSDKNPRAFLYTLLFSLKKVSQLQFSFDDIRQVMFLLFPLLVVILIVYFLLRNLYRYYFAGKNDDSHKTVSKTEIYFSVFAAALIGMGLNLLLIFMFQINFGTLYLYFGLITAVFMLGMVFSSLTVYRLLNFIKGEILFSVFSAMFAVQIAVIYFFTPLHSVFYFGVMFFLAGFFSGSYFPLSAYFIKQKSSSDDFKTASALEIFDNIGGAAGSLFCSNLLIPVLGLQNSLILFILLTCLTYLNFILIKSHSISDNKNSSLAKLRSFFRISGFTVAGILLIFLFLFYFNKENDTQKKDEIKFTVSQKLLSELLGTDETVKYNSIEISGKKIPYMEFFDKQGNHSGYIFKTADFTDYDKGYAGPINLLSYVSKSGIIKDFTVIDSNETPAYLKSVMSNKNIFLNQNSFGSYEDYGINAVTGATVSSKAVSETLYRAGSNFSRALQNKVPEVLSSESENEISLSLVAFLAFIIAAVFLRTSKKKIFLNNYARTFYLLIVFAVLGCYLNIQYSTEQILSLISGCAGFKHLSLFSFLCVGIPVSVILLGNFYCGYLCPFGALQELLNSLSKIIRLNISANIVSKKIIIIIRSFKYVLLFAILFLFLFLHTRTFTGSFDVLQTFFSFMRSRAVLLIALSILAVSFFFNRFWCRVLCPSGAFLSLMNFIHLIFSRKQKIVPENCDIGVTHKKDFDCICCNKCIINMKRKSQVESRFFSAVIFTLSLLFFIISIFIILNSYSNSSKNFVTELKQPVMEIKISDSKNGKAKEQIRQKRRRRRNNGKINFTESAESVKSIGEPRKIDIFLYKNYIEKSYLSDKEALYYRKLGE